MCIRDSRYSSDGNQHPHLAMGLLTSPRLRMSCTPIHFTPTTFYARAYAGNNSDCLLYTSVAEAGNISVAAKRLYLSQPSLSIQIKDLEDVMQVPLLVRDHKGVRATPAAEILITGGRELLRMRDEICLLYTSTMSLFLRAARQTMAPLLWHASSPN